MESYVVKTSLTAANMFLFLQPFAYTFFFVENLCGWVEAEVPYFLKSLRLTNFLNWFLVFKLSFLQSTSLGVDEHFYCDI